MIAATEIVSALWSDINSSSLKTALASGGGVYKNRRPTDSKKEDIVINSLPVNSEQLQKAVANVNIYVPDKMINLNGTQTMVIDYARFAVLLPLATALLKEKFSSGDWHYELQQVSDVIEDKESGSHFVNIRIEFFNINTN